MNRPAQFGPVHRFLRVFQARLRRTGCGISLKLTKHIINIALGSTEVPVVSWIIILGVVVAAFSVALCFVPASKMVD
jgi:hypothetical protein